MKKYKFTGETMEFLDQTLHRIQAVRAFNGVNPGDNGGWILGEKSLSHSGDAWVYGDARVYGDAQVYGDARVSGNAWVYGNAQVYGYAQVSGDAWEFSPLYIQGTRHPVMTATHTTIKIGCQHHPVEKWISDYHAIGNANGYSGKQIAEYGELIQLAASWLKLMVQT